jgi:hypothetical protein
MISELLLATALAGPLDDAAAEGRPIVVLLDRGPWRFGDQRAVWLAHTGGRTRNLLSQVTLVLATPAEVEAWTGAEIADHDLMVRIDPDDRRLAARAAFAVVPPPPLPPAPPDPSDWDAIIALDPDVTTAFALRDELQRGYDAAVRRLHEEAAVEVVVTWDRELLRLMGGAQMTARPPGALRVIGATRCRWSGCGARCDEEDANPGPVMCGMGHVTAFNMDFLKRWPPEVR